MSETSASDVRDVTASADRLREVLSVLPGAVADDVREEPSPYPVPEGAGEQPVAPGG